jgi:hypothetical protein
MKKTVKKMMLAAGAMLLAVGAQAQNPYLPLPP